MKLLADESVEGPIVRRLRDDGHVIDWISEFSPGLPDWEVLARAYREGVVLLTFDKDFGELVYRQRKPHAGVLLLRLNGLTETDKCDLVSKALMEHGFEFIGAYSVLDADDLRIRKSPTN